MTNVYVYYFFLCILFFFEFHSMLPLSFKNVSSWVFNYKEESFYQEYLLDHKSCLIIKQTVGTITVKTWEEPKIVIEARKAAKDKDLSKCYVTTTQGEHTIAVHTNCTEQISHSVDYVIIMPQNTDLVIEAQQSDIVIKGVNGSINIVTDEGSIDIRNTQNALYAKNNKGPIDISIKKLPDTSMISLQAYGAITVFLPLSINATLQAKAPHGIIESEHEVTIKSFKAKLNNQTWDNCKREVFGTLGNGGPKIKLHAQSGNIKLMDY